MVVSLLCFVLRGKIDEMAFRSLCLCVVLKNIICKMLAADSLMFAWDERLTINSLSVNVCQPLLGPVFVRSRKFEKGGFFFHISLRKKSNHQN